MTRKELERLWVGGAVIVGLLVVLISYFVLIAPERGQTRDINAQVDDATTQNAVLSHKIATLNAQNRDLAKYQADLASAELALPSTSGLTDFLHTLQSIGTATGADASLSVAPPTDLTTSTTQGATTAGLTVNGAHVYAIPINAQVVGTVAQLNAFLDQLQSVQPRAVLISQITEATASTAQNSAKPSLALTMDAFVAPSSAGENASLAAQAQG